MSANANMYHSAGGFSPQVSSNNSSNRVDINDIVITEKQEAEADTEQFFPEIMQKRKAMISYSRRMEILELTGYIEKTEKQISSLEGSVADDDRKIRQLNEHIRDLRWKIKAAGEEKEALIAKRAQLELLETDTVKLLEE